MKTLLERADIAPKFGEAFEKIFTLIKKDPHNKKYIQKLSRLIKLVYNNRVKVQVRLEDIKDPNMMVATIPTNNTIILTNKLIKKIRSIKDLKELDKLPDDTSYIEEIRLFITYPILNLLTEKELTAVLFHEFGHTFQYASLIKFLFLNVLLPLLKRGTLFVNMFLIGNFSLFLSILLTVYAGTVLMRFISRKYEYGADSYAVRLGYGDELLSALDKLNKAYTKEQLDPKNARSLFLKIILALSAVTHPLTENRVARILNLIIKKYAPDYSKSAKEGILKKYLELYNKVKQYEEYEKRAKYNGGNV